MVCTFDDFDLGIFCLGVFENVVQGFLKNPETG